MNGSQIRRALLPLFTFGFVLAAHVAYRTFFKEAAPGQDRWATAPATTSSWLDHYVASQAYFLGLSYASACAYAATSFRRYRERRLCSDRNLALGGITVSGFLALAGCYLAGCCGSPMLGVYVSLLGPWFLPWTGPLTLGLTLGSLASSWFWMTKREGRAVPQATCCAGASTCATGVQSKPQISSPQS